MQMIDPKQGPTSVRVSAPEYTSAKPGELSARIEEAEHSAGESEKHILELKEHIHQLEDAGLRTERARGVLAKIQDLLETKREILRTLQSMTATS